MKHHSRIVVDHFIFNKKHGTYCRRSLRLLCGRNILSLFEMMRSTLPLKRKTISLDLVANGKRGRGNCLSAQKSGKEELGSCIHVRRAVKKST